MALLVVGFLLFSIPLVKADGVDSAEIRAPYHVPWSGYWFPDALGTLVTGNAQESGWWGFFSPMEKYGAADGSDPRGTAWQLEYMNHYDPNAPGWYGHCNGWAAASVVEEEPTAQGELNAIFFRVGDKKGLLTELHQFDGRVMYGQRFNGNTGDDPVDIYPDLFHQTLVHYIKDLGKPILFETDPGVAEWNYPCWKYEMSWTDEGDIRHVTTKVYLAWDGVRPDFVGLNWFLSTYTYDLTMQGGQVVSGVWTGDSVSSHPDFLWEDVDGALGHPWLNKAKVTAIVNSSLGSTIADDQYVGNNYAGAAALLPYDVFFGRLLDDDWLRIPVEAGETVDIAVHTEKLDVAVASYLKDIGGASAGQKEFTSNYEIWHSDPQPEDNGLFLQLHPLQAQSSHENYGLEIIRTAKPLFMPHIANDCGWSTQMFLFNPGTQTENINYNFYRTVDDTVEKPSYPSLLSQLEPGKMVGGPIGSFFQGFDSDCQRWLKIYPSGTLEGFCLFTDNGGQNMAAMPLQTKGGRKLYFNHLAVDTTWWTGVSIANTDPRNPVQVTLTPYTPGGIPLLETKTVGIAAGGRYINMLAQIFSSATLAQAGWIQVESDRDVAGFELFGTNSLSMSEGIPLQQDPQTTLFAPWVPPPTDNWWAGITLVNPSYSSATVKIYGYTADGIWVLGSPYYKRITITGCGKYVNMIDQLLTPHTVPDPGPVAYVKIVSDLPLTGFVLYGNFTTQTLCGYTLADSDTTAGDGIYPLLDGETLIFNNALGDKDANITLEAYNQAGVRLAVSLSKLVSAVNCRFFLPQEFFPEGLPSGTAWVIWKSDQSLLSVGEILQDGRGTVIPSLPVTIN